MSRIRTYSSLDTKELKRILSLNLSNTSYKFFLELCCMADKRNLIKLKENPYKSFKMTKSKFYRLLGELEKGLVARQVNLFKSPYIIINPSIRFSGKFQEKSRWQYVFDFGTLKEGEHLFHCDINDIKLVTIEDYPANLDSTRPIKRVGDVVCYTDTGEVACIFPKLLIDSSDLETSVLRNYYEDRVHYLKETEKPAEKRPVIDTEEANNAIKQWRLYQLNNELEQSALGIL